MKSEIKGMLVVALCAVTMMWAGTAVGAIEAPKGAIVERNVDLAAEKAIDAWIAQLQAAPHLEDVKNIGILPLAGDASNFTELLAAKLTSLQQFHVVILSGKDWMSIEEELARTDPNEGYGDIMDKASIKWSSDRGDYTLPDTALGADALLLGHVRQVDSDWLRARARFTLHLAGVEKRTQIAGGIAEGESVMSWKDLLIYYKIQVIVGVLILIGALIVLAMLRGMFRSMGRPR